MQKKKSHASDFKIIIIIIILMRKPVLYIYKIGDNILILTSIIVIFCMHTTAVFLDYTMHKTNLIGYLK